MLYPTHTHTPNRQDTIKISKLTHAHYSPHTHTRMRGAIYIYNVNIYYYALGYSMYRFILFCVCVRERGGESYSLLSFSNNFFFGFVS